MENCIFCKIIRGELNSWKVYEDEHTYAFFDINPMNEYHTLVIPKEHYTDIFDIPEETAAAVMRTIKKVTALYNEKLGVSNVQIINNNGKYAQQDVFHIHFHIVPRFEGDGQNVKWPSSKKEIRERFDGLLERLG